MALFLITAKAAWQGKIKTENNSKIYQQYHQHRMEGVRWPG
jgi:hypothetical protein